MIRIENALKVQVVLVLKLCDFVTGMSVAGGNGLEVKSGDGFFKPVVKPDGYFVFTGHRPDSVRITSKKYNDILIDTKEHNDTVLRLSLVPRESGAKGLTVDKESHIGFGGKGAGYQLAGVLTKDSSGIRLQKDDLNDITDLFHVLISSDGEAESVYLTKNLGGGHYALKTPPVRDYPVRGTRLIPLSRIMDGSFPVREDADTVYILSGGKLEIVRLGEM